ncbi:MAG: hypothetical protein IJW54_04020 [Clostridia bacterium]|nr:hypothetical protein [Clostridia bacterium]
MTRCKVCGQIIHLGESYFSLSSSFFHSDCLLDNYTVSEVLELLSIEEMAMSPFDSLDSSCSYYLLGKGKNIRVTKDFYEYFVKRFSFFREVIFHLSEYKAKNNISDLENDQTMLEWWALNFERQGNFLNGAFPSGYKNDKCT